MYDSWPWMPHREKHVLLILVDSSGVRNRVCVLDDRYRLTCGEEAKGVSDNIMSSQTFHPNSLPAL